MVRTTRTATITAGAVAAAAAVAIALVACQPNPEVSASPSPSATTTSPSPSPSPTEASMTPEDEATEAAEEAVHAFYRMSNVSNQDPTNFKIEQFETVAIGTALAATENYFNALKANGYTQIGETEVVSVTRTSVDLTNDTAASPPKVPFVEFDVCWDQSKVNVVDKDGKSVKPADVGTRGVIRVGVANYEYPDGPWLVDFTEARKGKTC